VEAVGKKDPVEGEGGGDGPTGGGTWHLREKGRSRRIRRGKKTIDESNNSRTRTLYVLNKFREILDAGNDEDGQMFARPAGEEVKSSIPLLDEEIERRKKKQSRGILVQKTRDAQLGGTIVRTSGQRINPSMVERWVENGSERAYEKNIIED